MTGSNGAVLITVGAGRMNAKGGRQRLPAAPSPAAALTTALQKLRSEKPELWVSGHIWRGDHRKETNWEACSSIGIDIDYYDAESGHAAPPAPAALALVGLAMDARLPGSVFHPTPRGARVFFCFEHMETDAQLVQQAGLGAEHLVNAALREGGVAATATPSGPRDGFLVDSVVSSDLARFLYAPTATVDGVARNGAVMLMQTLPYELADLVIHAPESEEPKEQPKAKPAPNGGPTPKRYARSPGFADAAARWNADHAQDWGPGGAGTCPVCEHHGCFGRQGEAPARWACFSANHDVVGIRGTSCWHGDALDFAAFERKLSRADVLREDGYLERPRTDPNTGRDEGAAKPKARFKIVSAPELLELEDPEWLIDDVLSAGSVAMLVGLTGSYKTFIAMDLARHIVSGERWCDRDVLQGPILYCAGEGDPRRLKLRYRAMVERGSGGAVYDTADLDAGYRFCFGAVPLLEKAQVDVFVDDVLDAMPDGARLVVIDTLSISVAGHDENSAQDMSLAIESSKRIRNATGACVLLVHHVGRDPSAQKRARGSSALDANVDAVLFLEREQGRGRVVRLSNSKAKDGPEAADLLFQFTPVVVETRPDGKDLTSGIVSFLGPATPAPANGTERKGLDLQKVREVLGELEKVAPAGLSKKQLMDVYRVRSERVAQDLVNHLMDQHGVTRELAGRGYRYYLPGEREGDE